MLRGLALALAALAGATVVAACGTESDPAGGAATAGEASTSITNVTNVLELRAAFNADAGSPRLLLLLSPT